MDELKEYMVSVEKEANDLVENLGKEKAISKCDEMIKEYMNQINEFGGDPLTGGFMIAKRNYWTDVRFEINK